ncbi:hypothetical protein [Curvivirga sp.]|uniref:hypothetical protein n=1 Tax=Curvivirga sp. TaxID=2856848 RepID=UPI003B5B09B6
MALYNIHDGELKEVVNTTFKAEGIMERADLQKMFLKDITPLIPEAMVIAEEYSNWEGSNRSIDLLCIDKNARLIVVELKRTEDGGHMDLQAIRYAAMISTMTFKAAVHAHNELLNKLNINEDAEERILNFLDWQEPKETFGDEVSIVLVSSDFSQEVFTSAIWLSQHDIDIRCIALKPYLHQGDLLINIEQRLPLPEASDFQFRNLEKKREERQVREQNRDLTRYDLRVGENQFSNLPKRQFVYEVVKEAIRNGAKPKQVIDNRRSWIILDGEHDSANFLINENLRAKDSTNSEVRRFFIDEGELFHCEGKTYAFTKMWGKNSKSTVDEIIERFDLQYITYKASC